MPKLKICMVNALFYPYSGGTENHIIELSAALVKLGVEVHVVTGRLGGTKEFEIIRGIKVHRVPCRVAKIPGFYPPPMVVARKFLRHLQEIDEKENFDLFHLHDRWYLDFNQVQKYARKTHRKLVVTIHNARPFGISTAFTIFGGAYELAEGKKVLREADKLIPVSKWTRNDMMKYNLPRSKFEVIYNGINPEKFRAGKNTAVKKKLGMKPFSPLISWSGRIIEQKGLEYLIKAMPLVVKRMPTTKLLIIGTGTDVKKLRKLAAKLKVGNSVIFYGSIAYNELNNVLRGCDVFAFPSIWEPFGIAILDAMASGLPVVASKEGGIPEIVENGKDGFLVEKKNSRQLAEALVKILEDKKLRDKMARNAERHAKTKFAWKKIARQTLALYKKVLETG